MITRSQQRETQLTDQFPLLPNDSSYSAVSSKDFGVTTLQFIETSVGKETMPVYAYLHRKDTYNRHDHLFYSQDLPQGLVISEEGALTEEIAHGEARPFHIVAVEKPMRTRTTSRTRTSPR